MFPSVLLTVTLLPAAPAALVAGPDFAGTAQLLDAPITEVTVFSDRARVRRTATVELSPGGTAVRWPDLPGTALIETIRVETEEGTIRHVEAAPIDRERVSIDQADQTLDRIETLTDQIALLDAERAVLGLEIGLLTALVPAAPVPEAQREGRPPPSLAPEIFRRAIDFVAEEQTRARARQRAIDAERRERTKALELAMQEVRDLDLGGFTDSRIQVLVLIESQERAKTKLELEYFVPAALWRPTYDLRFFPDQSKVIVETSASVEQSTGEDWDGVELSLSTAIPGQSIALPELLTWTLGEAKELIPTPRPRIAPPTITLNPPPAPSATTIELERQAAEAQLQARLERLGLIAAATPSDLIYEKKTVVNFEDAEVDGELASPEGAYVMNRPRKRTSLERTVPRPASGALGSPPALAPQEESGASYASPTRSSASNESSGPTTMLALFEAPPPPRLTFGDQTLPAMSSGGFDYVYRSPSRVSVPSGGVKVRAPLAANSYSVTTYYEATPALASTAYLKATVQNDSKQPLLRGRANIFVNDAFAGEAELKTTGPGGRIELPLGADEDLRFIRKVIPKTSREGVFSKSDVTEYEVIVEVGSYKKRAVRVEVTEVVPRSSHEKVEVELLKIDPKPSAGPDGEGIFRWTVEVPPGKTKTLRLHYQVERPADWQLHQP